MAYPYGPYPPSPYQGWHYTPYYYAPAPGTPYIPNLSLYNSSPWARTSPLPPVSPYLPPNSAPANVPFPTEGGDGRYSGSYVSLGNVATPMRERRPSLHTSPYMPPSTLPDVGRARRHSFNAGPPTHWAPGSPNRLHLNPWIDGESPRIDFDFDLSKARPSPLRLYGGGQALELGQEELNQPATYPSLYKLRIVSDEIPDWPIELQPVAQSSGLFGSPTPYPNPDRPILLSDILIAIHRSLHNQIRQPDYDRLNGREKEAVGQAYRARCTAAGTYHEQEAERQQGIKRIDFFGRKKKFVGLTRLQPTMGWENMKLHTR